MKNTAPYIIAEIASAHEGDPAFARKLFKLAAATGTDAVKFQLFNRNHLLSRFHPKFESFGEIEIAPEEWVEILKECSQFPVDIIVEAFDEASLELAESTGVAAAYKLPTSDISNTPFLQSMAATGKTIFLGVGGAMVGEIAEALQTLKAAQSGPVILMHGFQAYPTHISDTNFARLTALYQKFGLRTGYADHIDADDWEVASLVPSMALSAGATVIEKHFTDDRSRKGRDHYSSLNPGEFKKFVVLIRNAAKAIGVFEDTLNDAERTYRNQMKRHAVAACDMDAGTPLSVENVTFKRTNQEGLTLASILELSGKSLVLKKQKDQPLLTEDFK